MKYCIVNEADRPYSRLVAQIIDGKAYYMSRSIEHHLKQYDGMSIDRATDIEAFGFFVEEKAHTVLFTKIGDSIAQYPDGSPRQWQGVSVFEKPCVVLED